MKQKVKYFVRDTGDAKDQLKNGSFIRVSRYNGAELIARYILGDYDTLLGSVPEGYVEVPTADAVLLIPKCCK